MKRMLSLLLICILCACGCGKKADPEPPEASAPSPVKVLHAEGQVDAVLLTWTAPTTNAQDEDLKNLDQFFVRRADFEKDKAPDWSTVGKVKVEDPTITSYQYRDTEVVPGKTYQYLILPVNTDGVKGEPGQMIRVTFRGELSAVN